MTTEKLYETPNSDLGDDEPKKPFLLRIWRRFYISLLWSFPIYMFFVVVGTEKQSWILGAVGSIAFSVGTGLLAIFIPSNHKAVFIPVSVIVGLVSAGVIGVYFG